MSESLHSQGVIDYTTLSQSSAKPAFRIRRDVLEALDPLRKMAALSAINRGYWLLVEEDDRHGTHSR
jgi:hypothetical protein